MRGEENKTMKKVIYILPGYGEAGEDQGHEKLEAIFRAQGLTPIHVSIPWQKTKPERFPDYVKQFSAAYNRLKGVEKYVFGFSFGATIAFVAAAKIKPKGIILGSLSPYFIEDQKKLRPSWLRFWKENFADSDYSFNAIAPKIRSKVHLIVGDKEGPESMGRAKAGKKMIANSKLTVIKGGKHDAFQKKYLKAIEKIAATLAV
jgi:pimeloyl-ACP methyl ester carboxylesterase